MKKTTIFIIFSLLFLCSYAQEAFDKRKETINVIYKFNFTDDDQIKEYFKNGHSFLINKTFSLNKALSVAPVLDYSYLNGKIQKHNFSIGADAVFFPLNIISMLKNKNYKSYMDDYFLSIGFYKTVNSSSVNSIFNITLSVYSFNISKNFKIAPVVGVSFYNQNNDIKDLTFSNIGVNFKF